MSLPDTSVQNRSAWAVFLIFLRLGLTSFGGPIAHLGYFRAEFVVRQQWLSERSYADLVALCQFLPGPASSQVGMALGLLRAGYAGAFAAWFGFTLPSALALILFALGLAQYPDAIASGALQGLKIVAVAVVAHAVWGMAKSLCTDAWRIAIMLLTTAALLLMPLAWAQVGIIFVAGLVGLVLFRSTHPEPHEKLGLGISRRVGGLSLTVFFVLLLGLPIMTVLWPHQGLAMLDTFYRAGALVFGGGHVVLPLLQAEVVPAGWVDNIVFLAGYGAAQAVPGPLFTFAGFLGAASQTAPSGWLGGGLALVAIFLPSFLLLVCTLPFWESLSANPKARAALAGVNAAVVGLLLAALYDPLWTSAILTLSDFALALLALLALQFWKLPPWLVVAGCTLGGWLLA